MLLTGNYTPASIDDMKMIEIQGELRLLRYLAEAIKENVPPKYRNDISYLELQNGLYASLDNLAKSLSSRDPQAISKAIKMLKPAYAKLFVNFG